nr:GPP34 family phosphoprotein [Kibdelosporangium phytohabitans]
MGDLSLCEALFFLGHDPFTGRARIRRDVLDIGLSAAALADLLFDERITLHHGTVVLISRFATGEPIADRALARIMAEQAPHGVRDWVEHIAETIYDTVVETLTVRELVTAKEKRGIFRHSLHYQPADLRIASTPRAAIRTAMIENNRCTPAVATLASIAWSVGVDDFGEPEMSRKHSAGWVDRVKNALTHPFGGLVSGTDAAVAAKVYGGGRG